MPNSPSNVIDFMTYSTPEQELPQPVPSHFRLLNLSCHMIKATHYQYSATLYHETCSIRVCWSRYHPDSRLKDGLLVSPRGLESTSHNGWAYKIAGLSNRSMPTPDLNLFHTIPSNWVVDRELIHQAADLVENMTHQFRHLFNAIFWDKERFYRFCTGPSSLQNHHATRYGNLRHSTETASRMQRDCAESQQLLDAGFCILLGLLHDAGKADEYRSGRQQQWIMSDRGSLVGHKVTVTEWIAVAREIHCKNFPESSYLALLHCLNSAHNAPQWLGVRESVMLEAHLLSGNDRTSGKLDLFKRMAPPTNTGWGTSHVHMKYRPYFVGNAP
ncbi:hypothetical protein FEMY_18800 [Ferrovum myxofaciens]|uniref:Uncharacterized protein n=2 Tax=root TaxID=1 RepID=A0A149VWH4_9PROT|nr:hypothetical protein FEMY_18800 [Ferrovum myxofaciens]